MGSPLKKYTGSESRKHLNIPDDAIVFGLVGRGVKEKGWSETIEAFNKVVKIVDNIEIHLIFVGDGEYLKMLKQTTVESINRIHYVGFSSSPGYWIQAFDVGMLPSHTEALGNVIIEYMFYNKPVIATKVGGIPETVSVGTVARSGLLVDLIDGKPDVNQLAKYMYEYIINPELRMCHAANTSKAIEKFSMNTCVDSYIALFEKVIAKKKNSN